MLKIRLVSLFLFRVLYIYLSLYLSIYLFLSLFRALSLSPLPLYPSLSFPSLSLTLCSAVSLGAAPPEALNLIPIQLEKLCEAFDVIAYNFGAASLGNHSERDPWVLEPASGGAGSAERRGKVPLNEKTLLTYFLLDGHPF